MTKKTTFFVLNLDSKISGRFYSIIFHNMKYVSVLFFLISYKLIAQLNVSNFPTDYQLIPRNETNIGIIEIYGNYIDTQCDSIRIDLYRNDTLIYKFIKSKNNFTIPIKLYAELSEYKLVFLAKIHSNWNVLKTANKLLCGDAILLYGQSNMSASSGVDYFNINYSDKFLRNYSYSLFQPTQLLWFPGKQPYAQVGSIGNHLMLNIVAHSKIPICIINAADEGKNVLALTEENTSNRMDKNFAYGKLLSRIFYSGLINHVKMIVYFQGEAEANTANDNCLDYPANWTILFNKLKQDLPNLKKLYEVQINVMINSYILEQAGFLRDFQRKTKIIFPENIETYSAIGQNIYDGIHYGYESYINIANGISNLMLRDFYGETNNTEIEPPNIQYAYYKPTKDTLVLRFQSGQNMIVPQENYALNSSFFLSESLISSIYSPQNSPTVSTIANGNEVILKLNAPQTSNYISYLTSTTQNNEIFFGPFLKNSKNHSAFSFFKFPIQNSPPILEVTLATPNTFRANAINDNQINITWSNEGQKNYSTEIWHSNTNSNFQKKSIVMENVAYFSVNGLKPESQNYFKLRICNNSTCSNFTNTISEITFKKRLYDCKEKNLINNITESDFNFQSNILNSTQKIKNSKINYLFEKNILLKPGFEFLPQSSGYFTTEQRNCE